MLSADASLLHACVLRVAEGEAHRVGRTPRSRPSEKVLDIFLFIRLLCAWQWQVRTARMRSDARSMGSYVSMIGSGT